MAKFKAAGRGGKTKQKSSNARGIASCLVLVIGGLLLVGLLFYAMLKQSR